MEGVMQPLPANARSVGVQEMYRRLSKYHGIRTVVASERLHRLKERTGRGGADDLLFDLTGGVFDPITREWLGTLTDGGA